MAYKIFLSPSNQDDNQYSYGNTTEAVQCGRMAEATQAALIRCGFEVKTSHMDGMSEKVRQSNAWGAILHLPIHTNACNGQVSGTRVMCYAKGTKSETASKYIFNALNSITPGTSSNVSVNSSLYEMKYTNATSVYIEVDFHDVPAVAQWLINHPSQIGEAIAKGVCEYFGVEYKAPTDSTQSLTDSTQSPTDSTQSPTDSTQSLTLYRVRKAAYDSSSQIGAFTNLENALALAKEKGYNVYDSNGNTVYQSPQSYSGLSSWKNGSTYETVYADTGKQKYVGKINPYEECRCFGKFGGMYGVIYSVDNTENFKTGFVDFEGV